MTGRGIALGYVLALLVGFPLTSFGQTPHPILDAPGFQPNRDYFSQQSFEHVDTLGGGLILTFTDLVLPGNAGRELRFTRVYNSKTGSWRFGVAGHPVRIFNPARPIDTLPSPQYQQLAPALHMPDGSVRKMAWVVPPSNTDESTTDIAISSDFRRFDRDTLVLSAPDGYSCSYTNYEPYILRIQSCEDIFGNDVNFAWGVTTETPHLPQLTVTQSVGASTRTVVVTYPLGAAGDALPTTMKYQDRTWTYSETEVTLPVADAKWEFEVGAPDENEPHDGTYTVTTPHGGKIKYTFFNQGYEGPDPQSQYTIRVIKRRETSGPGVTPGTWTYDYQITQDGLAGLTKVVQPSGTSRILYTYGSSMDPELVFDGLSGVVPLAARAVQQNDDDPQNEGDWKDVEREELSYQLVPSIYWGSFGTLEIDTRTTKRYSPAGSTTPTEYATSFSYSANDFGDYHNPNLIEENGPAGDRVTERSFLHLPSIQVLGLPLTEDVSVNSGDEFSKSWSYDTNGFKLSETIYGIETTFREGLYGNVDLITKANGTWTSLESYKYGQPQRLRTPLHLVTRVINHDGSLAQETRAGRTTTFSYDKIGRPRVMQPPGQKNPIVFTYDDDSRLFTKTRGVSEIETKLDGFGRPIEVSNTLGVVTKTVYDAEGRVEYEGYPHFTSGDIGTAIEYDAMGRVISRANPGHLVSPSISTRTYGANGLVTLVDEEGRTTSQRWEAFGDPNQARLAELTDADGKVWTYSYDDMGHLALVGNSDDSITRQWNYVQGLLMSETHPESGQTSYTYDAAGVMLTSEDANGVTTTFEYDDNDRVTKITAGTEETTVFYEAGSDNRIKTVNPSSTTTWRMDSASGRLQFRQDKVDGKTFTTLFEYDNNDNVTALVYPSGRRIEIVYNTENQATRVHEPGAGRNHADDIAYHPSGGVASYESGNGLTTTITYDPLRYWMTSTAVTSMQLGYTYDRVGNPLTITDSRGGFGQSFSYDNLDRLTGASGVYGTASYSYDVHGNRNSSNYSYEANTLRLAQQDQTSFTYDDNGNMLTAGADVFTYTPRNQVKTAQHNSVTANYAYNADEQRVKKTIGGSTTYFIRGINGELLTEWKDPGTSGGRVRDYMYLGSRLLTAVAIDKTEDPTTTFETALTPSHRFATSWQVPVSSSDNATVGSGITASARKSNHPDMPRAGLRLGVQGCCQVTAYQNGPVFIGNNTGQPKQGGIFFEFEFERLPYSANAEILYIDGNLRLFVTPEGKLLLIHDGGQTSPQTILLTDPIELRTPHTFELRFEYNSKTTGFVAPNPPYEGLTSNATVLLDGAVVAAGGPFTGISGPAYGLDKSTNNYHINTQFRSPQPTNGLLMDVWRVGTTAAQSDTDHLDHYGDTWRTTLLEAAGTGTYTQWTGGQPDWRARSAVNDTALTNVVSTNVANNAISYQMESMTSRGITGDIGTVIVGVRMQAASTTSKAFYIRNGVEVALTDLTLQSSDTAWYRVSQSGWLASDVIEVGVTNGTTTTNHLQSVMLLVEHNTPEPAPLADATVRVMTVNYTGNGGAQTVSFGVAQQPTAMFVMPVGASGSPYWWWDSRIGASTMTGSIVNFSRLWPRKGEFHVVHTSAASTNANGVAYVAVAIFDPTSRYILPFAVSKPQNDDNYTHVLRYPHTREAASTFTPDFVFGGFTSTFSADATRASLYRGPGHTGDLTGKLGGTTASDADRIQALGQGTVEFGASVHSASGDHAFFAGRVNDGISTTRLMAVTSFTGDGTTSRTITLDLNGTTPVLVFVVPTNATAKVFRSSGDTTGRQTNTGAAVANSITALGAGQITVGSALNANGVTYDVWAIRTGVVTP